MRVFDRIQASKRRWKFLAAGVLVLSLILVFIVPEAPHGTDSWVAVNSRNLEHEIGLVGKVEPVETAILTAPFEGFALDNNLSPGMYVEEGQALLTLDTRLQEVKVRDALASKLKAQQTAAAFRVWDTGSGVRQARQALRLAELAMQRLDLELAQVKTLYQSGIVSRNERDTLKQQRDQQLLEVTSAKAQLKDMLAVGKGEGKVIADMEYQNASIAHERLNTMLEQKTIHAPFPGVVLSIGAPQSSGGEPGSLHKGASLAQGQQILKLANISGLKVVTQVLESDVNKFSLNQPVAIHGEGFSVPNLNGYVSAISQLAVPDDSSSSARFPITITVNDPEDGDLKKVRLGMSAHMTIVTYSKENSLVIPHGAVEKEGDAYVIQYRERLDAPVVRREVTIGQSTVEGVEVFGLDPGFVRVKADPR